MLKSFVILAVASFVAAQDDNPSSASVTDDEMGPAAFMWPPDRVWSGDVDNRSPCGSRASAGNRTEFPLSGGAVALVAQDDYYNSKISISYSNDPTSNDDFTTLIEEHSISDLDPGHTCVDLSDLPSSPSAGDNATLQIIYRADWDAPHNQTFYACADIVFVEASEFTFNIPCFNATEPGEDDIEAGATASANPTATHKSTSGSSGSSGSSDNSNDSNDSDDSDDSSNSGGSKKLSGGAIAGIVVGSVVGVIMIAVGALLLWRRKKQQRRSQHITRLENERRNEIPLGKVSTSHSSAA